MKPQAAPQPHSYLARIELPVQLPTDIYGCMLAIWHLRPHLQRQFPLHKGGARVYLRYLAWCMVQGRRDYAILRELPSWDAALNQPLALPPLAGDRWAGGFSVAMFLFGVARYRYTIGSLLSSAACRNVVARAYWQGQRHLLRLPPPAPWQQAYLRQHFGSLDAFVEALRPPRKDGSLRVAELLAQWQLQDIAPAFAQPDDAPVAAVPAAVSLPANLRISPIPLPRFYLGWWRLLLNHYARHYARRPTPQQLGRVVARIPQCRQTPATLRHPFGVNLVGYARGELGIGEDLRLVAQALSAHGIPLCIINFKPGANVSQRDGSVDHWLSDTPKYAINLFCMTGMEHGRCVLEQGPGLTQGRYNIGLWPWELPLWPANWQHAYALVDEIWGISRYTAAAYAQASCPVLPMSLPVSVTAVGSEGRAWFKLPPDDYLFIFSFDYNSSLARKNPAGVVQAFQQAFPLAQQAAVGLVIKVSHAQGVEDPAWLAFKRQIAADPRIHLIEATYRKPQVLALYRACNCYVSLHRAEGFGRSLVEARLLGLPVIATGYSGNVDYAQKLGIATVNYHLQPLQAGDHYQWQGQTWAQPDISHAAALMRQQCNQVQQCDTIHGFSPVVAGAAYAQRLQTLKARLYSPAIESCEQPDNRDPS